MRKTTKKSTQLLEEDEEDAEGSPFKRQLLDSDIMQTTNNDW
jgi:hypothetical protein